MRKPIFESEEEIINFIVDCILLGENETPELVIERAKEYGYIYIKERQK